MERRRILMQSLQSAIDTTPVVYADNSRWNYGSLIATDGAIATIIYKYPAVSYGRTLVYTYGYGLITVQFNVFTDGIYTDYWSPRANDTRNVLKANTNGIAFTISKLGIDDVYAYIPETGQILFAGRNTIYYGHLNISELN